MVWKKLGLVFVAKGEMNWGISHAFIPTTIMMDEERIRVYVGLLDRNMVGRVSFMDVAAEDPRRILRISDRPVLDIGTAGAFDDNGVNPACVVEHMGKLYMYYIGWQLGVKVRYFLFVGLAISDDGGETFERYSRAPILDRSDSELYERTAACVHRDHNGWRMWYVAGNKWVDVNGKQLPSHNIRYLESGDGIEWGREGKVCLDLSNDDEFGLGRPYVVRDNGVYRMWYSVRTRAKGYRLGYAESSDGLSWVRKDHEIGIDVSREGWDSQMICYSCVQKTKYGTYMFYNGNNYGESGFGVARLEREG